MERLGLRNDQWERIKDILPGREGHVVGTAEDNRLFVEAVLYRFRTGCPWRDLPERFGHWKSVHQRISRWAKSGVFDRIFKLLASDRDNEYMMIDATIVSAHQHSAGARKKNGAQAIGRFTFLRNHAPNIAAIDLFIVPTIGLNLLYVLVIIRLARRELVWINVTANPTAEWIARQITEAFPWDEAPRYLIRDRDGVYGAAVTPDCGQWASETNPLPQARLGRTALPKG
jgi:transposase